MALQNPVSIYVAASNVEAHLVCQFLLDASIEAAVVEDVSAVGMYSLGTLDGIHQPKVWVDRSDAERALTLIDEYEDRRANENEPTSDESFCYFCGEPTAPDAPRCPACGKTLAAPDTPPVLPDYEPSENPYSAPRTAPEEVSGAARLRSLKKPVAILFLVLIGGPLLLEIVSFAMALVRGRL